MRSATVVLVPYVLTAAIGAVAGALGGGYYVKSRPASPPLQIRVVDMRRIVDTIARDPLLDEAGRRARTQEISDVISRFVADQTEQGVLVLDGSAVLRAPADFYIEPSTAP